MLDLANEVALVWARANAHVFADRPAEFGARVAAVARAVRAGPAGAVAAPESLAATTSSRSALSETSARPSMQIGSDEERARIARATPEPLRAAMADWVRSLSEENQDLAVALSRVKDTVPQPPRAAVTLLNVLAELKAIRALMERAELIGLPPTRRSV